MYILYTDIFVLLFFQVILLLAGNKLIYPTVA